MNVPPPTADAGAVVAAPGSSVAPSIREGGGDPEEPSTVRPVPDPVTGPPVARRVAPRPRPARRRPAPIPTPGCPPSTVSIPAELLDHLAAEREWYDLATTHLYSLASVLRSEMVARVPEERRSGTWSRMRFSYYTQDARDSDYPVIWRESRHDLANTPTISADRGRSDDDFVRGTPHVVLDVNTLDAGTGYLDLGLSIVSPSRGPAGLRRRHQRRRGVRAPVPRPADRPGPSRRRRGRRLHRRVDDRLVGLPLHRARRAWRHERVRRAPARHRPGRRHRRPRRARPPVRAQRPPLSQRAGDRAAQREPGHHRGLVRRPQRAPTWPRARSAAGAPGVEYRAEHVRDGGLPARHRRRRRRVPDGVMPGARTRTDRTTRPGARSGPRTQQSVSNGSTRSTGTSWRHCGVAATACCAILPNNTADDLAGPGVEVTSRFPGGELQLARNTWYDAAAVAVDRRVPHRAAGARRGLLDRRLGDRHPPRRGPGPRPGVVRDGGAQLPRARRHARPGHRRAAPRHPARRDGAGGAVRLRGLRVLLGARVGGAAAVAARPRGRLRAHPHPGRRRVRPALVARRPADRQAAHVRRPPRRRRRAGRRRPGRPRADRHPRAQRGRSAPGRGRSASGPTAGARWWPRCRSSTWSARCSTTRSR